MPGFNWPSAYEYAADHGLTDHGLTDHGMCGANGSAEGASTRTFTGRDSSGARLCVNVAPTCQKAHHFLPRVP